MNETITASRRGVLGAAAALNGVLATAGCIEINRGGDGGPPDVDAKFRLKSSDLRDGLLEYVVSPLDVEAKYELDYSEDYKRAKLDELVGSGTVSARGWPIAYRRAWGEEHRAGRHCLRYEDTYYRVRVEEEADVTREQHVLFLDWTADDPGEGDDVRSPPVESLSERDREILDAAVESVPASGRRIGDPSEYGVVYHDDLDAEESDLVPEPPFDYLETDRETFAVRARTIDHERTERTYSAEAIAETESEYLEYARSEFPDARISDVDLSSGARDVLDTATHPGGKAYEEEPPLSEDLEEVLEVLGIAEHLRPHEEYEERVEFYDALARHREQWFELDLLIYP